MLHSKYIEFVRLVLIVLLILHIGNKLEIYLAIGPREIRMQDSNIRIPHLAPIM